MTKFQNPNCVWNLGFRILGLFRVSGFGFRVFSRAGFSLLETLIALAVLALLATVIMSGLSSFRESAALDQAVDETLGLLREARTKTLGSEAASNYGIHFTSSSITLFKGGTYSPGDPTNTVIPLSSNVAITNINLSTTTSSVVFERLTGASHATGAITFTGSRSDRTRQIQILDSGAAVKL